MSGSSSTGNLFGEDNTPIGWSRQQPAQREANLTRRMRVLLAAMRDDGRALTSVQAADLFGCTQVELSKLWHGGHVDRRAIPGGCYTWAATVNITKPKSEGQSHAESDDVTTKPLE